MISKFREVDRAVAFLCTGLGERAPDACADVTWFFSGMTGKSRSRVVGAADLASTLEGCCKRFPAATVIIESDHRKSLTAAIQCRCDHHIRSACPYHCRHHEERPMVCVMVCSADKRPSDEERRTVLRMFQERIHGYQVDYKKEHPTEYRQRRPRLGRFRRL